MIEIGSVIFSICSSYSNFSNNWIFVEFFAAKSSPESVVYKIILLSITLPNFATKIPLFIQLCKYIAQKRYFFMQYSVFIAQNRLIYKQILSHLFSTKWMVKWPSIFVTRLNKKCCWEKSPPTNHRRARAREKRPWFAQALLIRCDSQNTALIVDFDLSETLEDGLT